MKKAELKSYLEHELKVAQKSLQFAIKNYTAAIHLLNEHTQNPVLPPDTTYYSNEDYSNWLDANLKFWNEDVEFWQEECHKLHTRLSLTIW